MANTTVTGIALTPNTANSAAGTAVTTGNVAVLTPASGTSFKGRYLLVQMTESGSVSTSTATFVAGPQSTVAGTGSGTQNAYELPATSAYYGNLGAVTFTSGQVKHIQVPLDRFVQADGTVQVNVGGASGSVTFKVLELSQAA